MSLWSRLTSIFKRKSMNEHTPERQAGESQEDYKKRRSMSNLYIKHRQRGTTFWHSYGRLNKDDNTYRKADFEPTTSEA